MKVQVLPNKYIVGTEANISFLRWLQLKLSGTAFYKYAKPFGYLNSFPFFISKCEHCKSYYVTRPHGQHDGLYPCPCSGDASTEILMGHSIARKKEIER